MRVGGGRTSGLSLIGEVVVERQFDAERHPLAAPAEITAGTSEGRVLAAAHHRTAVGVVTGCVPLVAASSAGVRAVAAAITMKTRAAAVMTAPIQMGEV